MGGQKHHLDKLVIHRFRGLAGLDLADLGRVNLFVGPNNSGKTSVLEAISTFCRPLDPLEWLNTAWRREVRSARTPQLNALKWLFPQTSASDPQTLYHGETLISGSGRFPVGEARAALQEIQGAGGVELGNGYPPEASDERDANGNGVEFSPPDDENRRGAELTLTALRDRWQPPLLPLDGETGPEISETFTLWEDERFATRQAPPAPSLPVTTITPVSHRVEQIRVSLFTEATFRDAERDVLHVVKLFDPGVKDLQILARQGIRPTLYIRHKDIGLAPLSAFGDGMRRALMVALSLPFVKDGVLLVDEIETAIHFSALRKFFTWLAQVCEQYNVQLFATTHSLEALDALLETGSKTEDGLVVFRLNEDRGTAQRLSGDLLYRLRYERGLEVR
jgi:energy-coupling factor transporter ATP-binding protein EcfA2